MTKHVLRTVVMVALFALTGSIALAQAPGYGYIEVGYLNVDPDNASSSGDNIYGDASIGLGKHFHVSGRYIDGDYAENVSLSYWQFAAGWHGLFGEKADLVAEATWSDQEIGTVSDDGVGANLGIRWRLIKWFEFDGFAHWTDYSDAGSQDSYELRAIFDIWRIGIGAAATVADEDKRYNAFIRFNFGKD